MGIDADLQFGGAFLEAFQFLVEPLISPFTVTPEVADGLADRPEEGVVGMRLETTLVSEGEHLIVDARGIADAQDVDAPVDEFLGYPVDGHVALGADQYLVFAAECLVDSLDEGGGFAGTGRPVDDGHILGAENLVDSILLCAVQVREVHRGEGEGLGLHGRCIEEVA